MSLLLSQLGGGNLTLALSAQAGNWSAGTLVPSEDVPLSGQSGPFSAGTVIYSAVVDLTLALGGVDGLWATGILAESSDAPVLDTHDPGYQVIRESDLKRRILELRYGKRRKKLLEQLAQAHHEPAKLAKLARQLHNESDDEEVLLALGAFTLGDDGLIGLIDPMSDEEEVLAALDAYERLLISKLLH